MLKVIHINIPPTCIMGGACPYPAYPPSPLATDFGRSELTELRALPLETNNALNKYYNIHAF